MLSLIKRPTGTYLLSLYCLFLTTATSMAAHKSDALPTLSSNHDCSRIGRSPFFTGGAPMLKQITGSHGPAFIYPWDIKAGKPNYHFPPKYVPVVIGFPDGHSIVTWSSHNTTLECNLGNGCLKPDNTHLVWQKGVIYRKDTTLTYCHIFQIRPQANEHANKNELQLRMVEGAWKAADNKRYSCPETIEEEFFGKRDLGVPLHYFISANKNTINDLPHFSEDAWSCKGSKTQNFNASSYDKQTKPN